jgi:alkanesulfonate monooxygenase SsuD/methylene tetrahydromethanopterin reductase-like flavin-dependent oxidoreductase (luciferase family)
LARVARYGQGWFTFDRLPADVPAQVARLEAALAEAGRSRSEVTLTVSPYLRPITADDVRAYADAGVDRLIVLALAFNEDMANEQLDRLVTDVLEPAQKA